MAIATLALAVGGLVTQWLAISTGRDFAFGTIPKLNPAGTGNLPVWFGSVAVAAGACAAGWLAIALRAHRRGSPRTWCVLAVLLAVLSLERMAMLSAYLGISHATAASTGASIYVGWMGLSILPLFALALAARDLPGWARRGPASALALLALGAVVATTAAPDFTMAFTTPPTQAVAMTAARVLELAGATLFVVALLNYAASDARVATIRLDSALPAGAWLQHEEGFEVRLSPRRVARALSGAVVAVLAASLVAALLRDAVAPEAWSLSNFLFVDLERNLPTWLSSLLLMLCAGTAALIASLSRHTPGATRRWGALALLFVALSADEAASFHELLVGPLRSLVRQSPWLRYPLILPGAVALVAGWAALGSFVRTLPRATRRRLGWGLGLFAGGALGLETVGGWFDPTVHGDSVTYVVLATLEEGLEMAGVIVALTGLLEHIERHIGPIKFPDPS